MNTLQFQENISRAHERMMRFALKLTMNTDDAKDLYQDTILKALRNKDKYRDDINFIGWILTVMRNVFLNNCQRLSRRNSFEERVDFSQTTHPIYAYDYNSPDKVYNMNEIMLEINQLDDNSRIPLFMYLAGYKYKEISEQTRTPIGTIKSRIFFARKGLQNSLKEFYYDL